MSAAPQLPVPPRPARPAPSRVADRVLRVLGAVVAVVGAVQTGVIELLFANWSTAFGIGRGPLPRAVLIGAALVIGGVSLVVAANVALSWFAHRVIGGWAIALCAVPWFALMVVATARTAEGDLLLTGDNWLGLVMIVAGAMTFAVVGFRLILSPAAGRSG